MFCREFTSSFVCLISATFFAINETEEKKNSLINQFYHFSLFDIEDKKFYETSGKPFFFSMYHKFLSRKMPIQIKIDCVIT